MYVFTIECIFELLDDFVLCILLLNAMKYSFMMFMSIVVCDLNYNLCLCCVFSLNSLHNPNNPNKPNNPYNLDNPNHSNGPLPSGICPA